MQKIEKMLHYIVLVGVVIALSACSTSMERPTTSATNVVRATLDNGLKVVIVRDPLAPVATQQMTYQVGANEAPQGFPGMAHAQEHMMFRGSPGLTGNQLSAIYARMGGDLNAYTTNSITSYFFTVPADDLDIALHVGAIRMAGVTDSKAGWKKERGAIEQEVASDKSSPFYVLYQKLRAHMFAGTPYAHDALGTKASFDKTTAAMLKAFHDKWYVPNNALLVVTGKVDPHAVLARIKKLYGAIPAQAIPAKPAIDLQPVKATTFTTKSDQPYGLVIVAFRMPGYRSPAYPAAKLAAKVLSSKRGPIAALRYEGLALDASFQMQTMPEAGIGLAFAVYPPGGDADSVKQALVSAIKTVRKKGVSADLVTAAKRRAVLAHELQRNSISGLAQTWTHALAVAGLNSPAEALANLRKVTLEQVNAVVRKRLDMDHAVTLIANPVPGSHYKTGQGFGGKESFQSKPKGPVKLPAWAAHAFAKLPHPKPFRPAVDMTLDNGLRLIVQPLDISHSVSLYGVVNQSEDMQAPKGQKGVAHLLNTLFEWGPAGMTRLEFDAAQDNIGAQLSVGSHFSLAVLPQYFDRGVQLLAKGLLAPSFPAKAFKMRQRLFARQVAGRAHSPQFKFKRAIQRALLPKGDPGLRTATAKTVESLTLAKLKKYYDKVYRPDETTIVVMGDIKPSVAKATIKRYFGDWKARGPKPDTTYPPIPLSHSQRIFVPDPVKKQNRVVMAETLDLNVTNPDHFALNLVNDLLSGGFYASPLYHVLREKLGLVYYVTSQFDFMRQRSAFHVSYGSYPDKVTQARRAAIKVLERTIHEPLTASQLHLAKSIGLRRIQLSKQSVKAIGHAWLDRSTSGLPLDQGYIMARYFEQASADDVQHIFKKYVNTNRLSTIILGQPID